jgi:hypothetical protein
MGSTGSGSFTDYSGSKNPKGDGGQGGSGGVDQCAQAFSCTLQEVAQCDYLKSHGAPPPVGSELRLALNGRVFAIDANGTTVGALPTSHNYLAACLKSGFEYVGVVTSSKAGPLPSVTADFKAK